ncbi:MAG: hypothetical protein KF781_03980 [Chitinophagaceae bacterium]|nr:hypothetical protein [Chitinophagaceae bacterium]MCW5904755.1 hypothetical protein [Chitinophagaceae bacterium]
MKHKQFNWLAALILTIATVTIIAACNKKFDEPDTTFIDPNLPVTMSLKELKALLPTAGTVVEITDDKTISGIVVADDRSGNFYKSISIQDATGGVSVRLDGTNVFNSYPVGRRVYINVKGLCIGEYGGMIQLGAINSSTSPISQTPIPQNLFDKYIVKGSFGNTITPKVITNFADLKTTLQDSVQNTLIQLQNFQVVAADTLKTYGDPSLASSAVNINVQNCSGNTIIMRSSSYANFAGITVPKGKGTITAIYTFFNGTKQLVIRDTADLQFNDVRCGGVSTSLTYKTIQEIRALGSGATIPANTGIRGVIVSNKANEAAGNYRIQDASASGIQLRFITAFNPNFDLDDSVSVEISGLSVDLFNGDMQINNVANSQKLGIGTIIPRTATVTDIAANINDWSSTVVQLSNVTVVQSSTNTTGINYDVTDATGTIVSFVRNALGVTPPANATSYTGYVSLYNGTPQITIRNASDVPGSGGGPTPGGTNENFESGAKTNYTDAAVTLTTGSWFFSDGLLGTDANDMKIGSQSARVRGTNVKEGFIRMEFDITGVQQVKFKFAGTNFNEGSDDTQEISVQLEYSKDGGTTWTALSKVIGARGSFTNASYTIPATSTENVRVKIVNTSFLRSTNNRLRVNIDDVELIK